MSAMLEEDGLSTAAAVLAERGRDYGNAHEVSGELLQHVAPQLNVLLLTQPKLWFSWLMIFNKLIRLLCSPTKLDSWVDIQGYAKLAERTLTKGESK